MTTKDRSFTIPGSRTGFLLAHGLGGTLQSFSVASGITRARRAKGPLLPKWQIAAKHRETRAGKGFCHRDQKRSLAV